MRPSCSGKYLSQKETFSGHLVKRTWTVTATVTEAFVLRPLLEDRRYITESIRILVSVDRMKQMFSDHDEMSPSIAAV